MKWIMKDGGLNHALVEGAAKIMHSKLMGKDNKLDFALEYIAEKFYILAARNGKNFDFYAFHQYEWKNLPEHLISVFLSLKPLEAALEAPPKKRKTVEEYPFKK